MELEFDKEMDALLRKAAKDGAAATVLDSHIDADEISMFAENAMPGRAKAGVISHLADCDRCRTILANVIALNADADEIPAAVPAGSAETTVVEGQPASWFSGLFTTRTLALSFGALALLFAGFIGISVIQTLNSGGSELAQADKNKAQAPARSQEESFSSNTTVADADENRLGENNKEDVADLSSADNAPVMGPKKGTVTGKDVAERIEEPEADSFADKADLGRRRDNKQSKSTDDREEGRAGMTISESQQIEAAKPAPAPAMQAATPRSTVITPRSGTISNAKKKAPKPTAEAKRERDIDGAAADSISPARKQINGKTFVRRNNAWYDTAYKNQPITNVKRGTTEFQALDAGVRTIATKLSGTVVVVWKSKALKIQ
jgi:hypothetical protein